jgi:hypothetical protein
MPSRPIDDHYSKESPKIEDDDPLLTEANLIAWMREGETQTQTQQDIDEMLDALDEDSLAQHARDEAHSRFWKGVAERLERILARQKDERSKNVLDPTHSGSKDV